TIGTTTEGSSTSIPIRMRRPGESVTTVVAPGDAVSGLGHRAQLRADCGAPLLARVGGLARHGERPAHARADRGPREVGAPRSGRRLARPTHGGAGVRGARADPGVTRTAPGRGAAHPRVRHHAVGSGTFLG